MPRKKSSPGQANEGIASLLEAAGSVLREARMALNRDIRAYPTPIPSCDAQFNSLLDQRRLLSRAMRDIETLLAGGGPGAPSVLDLCTVVEALERAGNPLAARLRTLLEDRPGNPPIPC